VPVLAWVCWRVCAGLRCAVLPAALPARPLACSSRSLLALCSACPLSCFLFLLLPLLLLTLMPILPPRPHLCLPAASWEHLKVSVPMLLAINIAGLPFAGGLSLLRGGLCCWSCAGLRAEHALRLCWPAAGLC
jgi:hypothetical protein